MSSTVRFVFLGLCVLALATIPPTHFAWAQSSAEVQQQIDDHNKRIADLEKEIATYQKQLNVLGTQKQTLQSAISTIDVSRKQTATQVDVTKNKIYSTDLTLSQLRREIATKEDLINLDRDTVAKSLRDMAAASERSLVEYIFAADSLTDAWTEADNLAMVNDALRANVALLSNDKTQLATKQDAASQSRDKLAALQAELVTQQKALDATKRAKAALLTETKNQESTYQQLITAKRAEQAAFEAALFELSSRLQATDTSRIPPAHKGVLAWPLDKVNITQQFGKTSDSGRLYASGTHDGIDFSAAIGTPVRAALTGTVLEINQGAVKNCQYGKWVLVKHANGLTTLYAHLSEISVAKGQSVATGQTLGFSGMTGYATGPHLHFTVYGSEAVSFKQYTCKSGYTVTVPIAPPNGYLNPLGYL